MKTSFNHRGHRADLRGDTFVSGFDCKPPDYDGHQQASNIRLNIAAAVSIFLKGHRGRSWLK